MSVSRRSASSRRWRLATQGRQPEEPCSDPRPRATERQLHARRATGPKRRGSSGASPGPSPGAHGGGRGGSALARRSQSGRPARATRLPRAGRRVPICRRTNRKAFGKRRASLARAEPITFGRFAPKADPRVWQGGASFGPLRPSWPRLVASEMRVTVTRTARHRDDDKAGDLSELTCPGAALSSPPMGRIGLAPELDDLTIRRQTGSGSKACRSGSTGEPFLRTRKCSASAQPA